MPAELANRPLIRKSVVCAAPQLKAGTRVTASMLAVKRPWTEGAVEPFELENIVTQLKAAMEKFWSSDDLRTCKKCGHTMDKPTGPIMPVD